MQFDGCTCKKHGKVLVIRVTAAVPKGASPVTGAGSDLAGASGQHQRLTAQIMDVLAKPSCASLNAMVCMGGHSGVIAQLNDVLMSLQNTTIRAQPCYSHGLHNTLLAGLTALGAGIKAAIEDVASLLAQHWGELSLARSGAKPETPCDTWWASYTTAAASVLRVWRLAGEAVERVVEGQRERSPPWAVTLSGYFKDTDLLLKNCVVAVVGMSLLQSELLWASQHDGLHAFELYRHPSCADQPVTDLDQQLAALVHCRAMSSYYEQHVLMQNALPYLFAALGSSDPAIRWEVANEVKHGKQIRAMAKEHALSEREQQQLQAHLEVYYLACPVSNAHVESLLQQLKHGTSMYMELLAVLELMSMRIHNDAIDGVDVLDFAQRLPELRKEVRPFLEALNAAHHPLALYPPQQIRTDSFSQAFFDYLRAIDRLLSMPSCHPCCNSAQTYRPNSPAEHSVTVLSVRSSQRPELQQRQQELEQTQRPETSNITAGQPCAVCGVVGFVCCHGVPLLVLYCNMRTAEQFVYYLLAWHAACDMLHLYNDFACQFQVPYQGGAAHHNVHELGLQRERMGQSDKDTRAASNAIKAKYSTRR
ncbi:hypothetical protein QJQ45_012816 [Haematococcus lacustris]|nr:hypothetical protein QJQ45_012816 [Haematococcus lacustris]